LPLDLTLDLALDLALELAPDLGLDPKRKGAAMRNVAAPEVKRLFQHRTIAPLCLES
jgi:hypothetical protein